ncbi:MAG: hypothetical protein P8163_06090 [Candidatus Thiodiazotropha sp.]
MDDQVDVMKQSWEWNNQEEMKGTPHWIELILMVVGLPVVLVSTTAIILPNLDLTNGTILCLIAALVIFMTKESFSKGKMINRQSIKIKDRVITYKINDEGRSYVLINIASESLNINRRTYPHTLEWLDGETNNTIQIPLIGMSRKTEASLFGFLDREILYQVEPILAPGKM